MKTYLKTLVRTFKKHITRFLSIIFIVVVSIGFVSGIGLSSDKMNYSLTDFYSTANVSDFIVKSMAQGGFTQEDISRAEELYGAGNVAVGTVFDVKIDYCGEERLTRLYFMGQSLPDWTINIPQNYCGTLPQGEDPAGYAYFEESDNKIKPMGTGVEITLDFKRILSDLAAQNGEEPDPRINMIPSSMAQTKVTLLGSARHPLCFGKDGEPSYLNPEDIAVPNTTDGVNKLICLEGALYMTDGAIPALLKSFIGVTDMWIAAPDRTVFNNFSEDYRAYTQEQTQIIEGAFEGVRVLTLYDNYSFWALHSYAQKVTLIGYVLMAAFIFVAALVVLSTMTRLVEEERPQTACLKTLGYSNFKILFKYLLFAALATGAGGVGAYFIGLGLCSLVYSVFGYSFVMPPMSPRVAVYFFLTVFAVIVAATLGATLAAGYKTVSHSPAELLRPKPPKAGKKTVLEKMPLIWNALSFKHKNTARNVLRYKSRFFMTVIAVAISTALVLAGLALLDLCLFHGVNSPTITAIAAVIVVFAGLLTAVVIYTLTNINVSERNRELATLMVLGYYNGEVAGYIYREIYADVAIGILAGYPLSLCIMVYLFQIMALGSIAGVSWFMWLIAPAVVLLFTGVVTLILRHKIVGIDMNESLKAVE